MFSATLDKEVRPICKKFMTDVSSYTRSDGKKASFFAGVDFRGCFLCDSPGVTTSIDRHRSLSADGCRRVSSEGEDGRDERGKLPPPQRRLLSSPRRHEKEDQRERGELFALLLCDNDDDDDQGRRRVPDGGRLRERGRKQKEQKKSRRSLRAREPLFFFLLSLSSRQPKPPRSLFCCSSFFFFFSRSFTPLRHASSSLCLVG